MSSQGAKSDAEAEAATLAASDSPGPERLSQRELEMSSLTEGTTIGRYKLVKRIGAGAMGVVWAAQDPQLDRMVAIKVVHPSFVRAPEAASRLMREARALAKVSHRSVVIVHDAGDLDEHLFIAMELVEGTTLGAMLRVRDAADLADWPRWLAMMVEAGRGLVAAHRAGVLHRDFKPDNVLVDLDGRVCVGDFGLAAFGDRGERPAEATRHSTRALDLTSTGALLGTPIYMSPQQLRSQEIDARADQYAFCVATWEAMYGARPFATDKLGHEAISDLAARIESGVLPPPPPGSTVPPEVRAHLARGLAGAPEARWPDMASLVDALASTLHRTPPSIHTAQEQQRGTRRLWIAVGLALVGAGALVITLASRDEQVPPVSVSSPAVPRVTAPSAKKLFSMPLRTGLGLSRDGRYFTLVSDRLQVRDVETNELWTTLLPLTNEVAHLEANESTVRFSVLNQSSLMEWKFRAADPPKVVRTFPGKGHWFGSLERGELYADVDARTLTLYAPDGASLRSWPFNDAVTEVVVSPNQRTFAFVEDGRFAGTIAWGDGESDELRRSAKLFALTSVTFVDDETLLYAQGTTDQPRIFRASITANGLGPPTQVHGIDFGWFGPMRAHAKRIYVVLMTPEPRTSILVRDNDQYRQRELDNALVSLGWVKDGEFLAWNRGSRRIERRTPERPIELTPAVLDGEPANATTAGPIVIAALRRTGGREAVAVSVTDGQVLWRHQDGRTLSVRCARDLVAPCFAIRVDNAGQIRAGTDEIVTLNPNTGELGATPIYKGVVEDIAVAADGKKLLLIGGKSHLAEISDAGTTLREMTVATGNLRSVAYDPLGGVLVGATNKRNNYVVLRMDFNDTRATLAESDDDILSLVRPSPDGSTVLYIARMFAPELWQLDFPTPLTAKTE